MRIVSHAVGCQTLQAVSRLSPSDSWERLQLPNDPELDYQKKMDVWMVTVTRVYMSICFSVVILTTYVNKCAQYSKVFTDV